MNTNEHAAGSKKEGIIEMTITDLEVGSINHDGFYPVTLTTNRGNVDCRYYAAAERKHAVIFIGNAKGGWDSPVKNMLYPSLGNYFARKGINCLRIKYRHPAKLAESILDVLAGISFLAQDGITSIALVGHSFGAAVAIQAAAASPFVSTVVSLSPQTFGAEAVDAFREQQSILLIHGTADVMFPIRAASTIYDCAHDPKKIILYKGANHNLDEAAPEVFIEIRDWIQNKMKSPIKNISQQQ
jgi:alpha/beta superfamily hydrolase